MSISAHVLEHYIRTTFYKILYIVQIDVFFIKPSCSVNKECKQIINSSDLPDDQVNHKCN